MDYAGLSCTVGFPFAFKEEGELRRYYEGWDMLKYNEDVTAEGFTARTKTATVSNCALLRCCGGRKTA